MANYETLSQAIANRMAAPHDSPYACPHAEAVRRTPNAHDEGSVWRPAFVRDVDKIMHCPYYNRYADKTQVFSLYRNDDITRRGLHVQYVSRIARTIGSALGLNTDLIEAIALGHDIGHAPFGHLGERLLDQLLYEHAGLHFSHNIQSVRVLDRIFPYNVSLQTLCGIAAHDGEFELRDYAPAPLNDFDEFDALMETCTRDKTQIKHLRPNTLEGCVVRISDIIAYLGKDRQDAQRAKLIREDAFDQSAIGLTNAEIVNNLTVNILENSFGKPYIRLDEEHFAALKAAKAQNYKLVYESGDREQIEPTVQKMMALVYDRLLDDLTADNTDSPVFTHHIAYVNQAHYARLTPYESEEPNRIVTDYIACMTDDYFIDLFAHLFPDSPLKLKYKGYFD